VNNNLRALSPLFIEKGGIEEKFFVCFLGLNSLRACKEQFLLQRLSCMNGGVYINGKLVSWWRAFSLEARFGLFVGKGEVGNGLRFESEKK
jgi:hypothetical protein